MTLDLVFSYKYTELLFLCIFKPVLDYTLTIPRTEDDP